MAEFRNEIIGYGSLWSPILPRIAEDTNIVLFLPLNILLGGSGLTPGRLGYEEEQPKSYITLGS